MGNECKKVEHKCNKCYSEATCCNGVMYLCDKCLYKAYNHITSENEQCLVCGAFGKMQHRTIDGRWLCSLKCLKEYFGYKALEGGNK